MSKELTFMPSKFIKVNFENTKYLLYPSQLNLSYTQRIENIVL